MADSQRDTGIRRGLETLLLLGDDEAVSTGGLGVTRIAELLDKDKSQVSRTLGVLAEYGFVERVPESRDYRLGPRIGVLAQLAGEPRLISEGQPLLEELVDQLQESAVIVVRKGDELLVVAAVNPNRTIAANGWVGRSSTIWGYATGRAMLFDETRATFDALARRSPPINPSDGSPRDPDEVWAALQADVERGYSALNPEVDPELFAVAFPVRTDSGLVAGLTVAGPRYRCEPREGEIIETVRRATDRLSAALGAVGASGLISGRGARVD